MIVAGFLPAGKLKKLGKKNRKGNCASALLEDGTTLVARSDSAYHSEEYLLQRAGKRKIVAVYSERQPCNTRHNCESQWRNAGGKNVSWSFQRNGVGGAGRAKVNKDLAVEISKLFKGK